ncbi:unnamed protein product, partial [Hapterophycus canaliculatus]
PRAGAPRPPRGEVHVRRPWGRHGAAAPAGASYPSVGGVGRGDAGDGGRGVAGSTPAAGSEQTSAPGGGASGAVGAGGEAKALRMRWQPKYLTVKAVFFLFYSSLGALMPYLPVYYHALGIPDRR